MGVCNICLECEQEQSQRSAKRYCRKLYEAGYTPICPLLSLPEVIDTSNADEYKDYMDMSEDMLRRSRILVVCGSAVDDTVLTDIAIANRFHVASSTMRGVLGVDKNKRIVTLWIQPSPGNLYQSIVFLTP